MKFQTFQVNALFFILLLLMLSGCNESNSRSNKDREVEGLVFQGEIENDYDIDRRSLGINTESTHSDKNKGEKLNLSGSESLFVVYSIPKVKNTQLNDRGIYPGEPYQMLPKFTLAEAQYELCITLSEAVRKQSEFCTKNLTSDFEVFHIIDYDKNSYTDLVGVNTDSEVYKYFK
jgi:hypothetical protein